MLARWRIAATRTGQHPVLVARGLGGRGPAHYRATPVVLVLQLAVVPVVRRQHAASGAAVRGGVERLLDGSAVVVDAVAGPRTVTALGSSGAVR